MRASSPTRRAILQSGALTAAAVLAPGVHAQPWPARPIKLVVGFSAGGTADAVARLVATHLGAQLGQQVVVENRTGAAGNLATEWVAKAPADGYTLLFSAVGQIVISPHTYSDMRVNPVTDLAPITMVGEGDLILNVNTQVPAQTLADFVALVKAQPDKLFYGDSGAGGNLHLYMAYFNLLAGTRMTAVHYRGTAQLMPDFIANQVQMSLNSFPATQPYVQQGKLRPLMIVGKQREPGFPEVPTAAEVGLKPLEVCTNWFGLHGPAGLPEGIRKRVRDALASALKQESMTRGLAAQAIRPVGDATDTFVARIAADDAAFAKVARQAKIQVG